ncbi:hypothetical protein M917_1051 [Psychrobacter aquaticus CMS 56]|uniref:Uncharacterized protein n=1 Tax=Psychrobacter aquaticus CMS 56 TaxID=1354303 RepID=U4T767_9GAMM|nr:hypothetical protein M917_1051 [Psychrobacter aquaticus CMS 56]
MLAVPAQTEAAKNLHQQYCSDFKVVQLYKVALSDSNERRYVHLIDKKTSAHEIM